MNFTEQFNVNGRYVSLYVISKILFLYGAKSAILKAVRYG